MVTVAERETSMIFRTDSTKKLTADDYFWYWKTVGFSVLEITI